MWGAPSSHIACCKLTQQIIPSCVNSDGPGTATETWSASTAKASTTSLYFKKATNLALVLNFRDRETPKAEWDLPAKAPWSLQAQETHSINSREMGSGAACLSKLLGRQQPTLPQMLQTLPASSRCTLQAACTNARTSAVYQIATHSLCVHMSQFTTAKAEVIFNKIHILYSAYENIWH